MVKVDLTRDYYGDLELQSGASESDIKKQFKKLALKYHPDRNPGREAEVNSKFQTIQSAHEVLTDVEQKAKYDAARSKTAGRGYGYTAPTASGTRGNPWASAGSQWAPPPKPPPFRKAPPASTGAQRYSQFQTPNPPKPADDGAESRRKTYQAWESMRPQPTREWQPPKPVPKEYTPQSGREESNNFKHAPPPKSSKPGYEEFRASTSGRTPQTSPKHPGPSRSQSTNGPPKRNGFMPGTPGGDEPAAASSSAYFTHRSGRTSSARQSNPPQPPPRAQPNVDPLRQFREKSGTPLEPRLSTPYATHGGEKTNPFENLHINRSKSTRERSDNTDQSSTGPFSAGSSDRHRSASPPRSRTHRHLSPERDHGRADSDTNLGSPPKRTYSYANRHAKPAETPRASSQSAPRHIPSADLDTSSDGDDEDTGADTNHHTSGTRPRAYAKRRVARAGARQQDSNNTSEKPAASPGNHGYNSCKQSLSASNQLWSSERTMRNMLREMKLDGPTGSHGHTTHDDSNRKNEDPSMYDNPDKTRIPVFFNRVSALPFVPGVPSNHSAGTQFPTASFPFATASSEALSNKCPRLFPSIVKLSSNTPSGAANESLGTLNAFETAQFNLLDELVTKYASSLAGKFKIPPGAPNNVPCSQHSRPEATEDRHLEQRQVRSQHVRFGVPTSIPTRSSYLAVSSVAKSLTGGVHEKHRPSVKLSATDFQPELQDVLTRLRYSAQADRIGSANIIGVPSFSFKVGDETFQDRTSMPKAFTSRSTENISTTFTPEDWHGKFEAGEDYFGKDMPAGPSRARSGSRTRTRSPTKSRPINRAQTDARTQYTNIDPEILQQSNESDRPTPTVSPGGTKFSAEEWAQTFKPQTFAPPPFPSPGTAGRSQYPSRSVSRRSRQGSTIGKPPVGSRTAGSAAMIDEDDGPPEKPLFGEIPRKQATVSTSNTAGDLSSHTGSPNAMDIDSPSEQAPASTSHTARNVPVEPSRPEWRAGDGTGTGPQLTSAAVPDLPRRSRVPSSSTSRNRKSTDSEDFKTNFEDLKNVEPFHHPATGLHSFSDLTSNLPFPSRAAASVPITRNFSSGQLDLPHPPRAPMVPHIPQNSGRPTSSSWQSYLTAFKAYMAEWDIFNTKIILHFVSRKNQFDAMPVGWLEAFGESAIDKYRDGLKEDIKVREWWDVACSKHTKAMDEFQWFREVMKEGMPTTGRHRKKTHGDE